MSKKKRTAMPPTVLASVGFTRHDEGFTLQVVVGALPVGNPVAEALADALADDLKRAVRAQHGAKGIRPVKGATGPGFAWELPAGLSARAALDTLIQVGPAFCKYPGAAGVNVSVVPGTLSVIAGWPVTMNALDAIDYVHGRHLQAVP